MSKRFQIASKLILEAYVSLNSTSGTIWARFWPQHGSQNEVQNRSKIDLGTYPRPNPPPKPIFEASETSPGPFSSSLRSEFLYFIAKQRKSLSCLRAIEVPIVYTTGRAVIAIAVTLPFAQILKCLHSDKAYLSHKFQCFHCGALLVNASCLGNYWERICDKFSDSISDMFVLNIDDSTHLASQLSAYNLTCACICTGAH